MVFVRMLVHMEPYQWTYEELPPERLSTTYGSVVLELAPGLAFVFVLTLSTSATATAACAIFVAHQDVGATVCP